MPAAPFDIDLSQPGKGVSITPADPATQQVVQDGEIVSAENPQTWVVYFLRRGSRIVETVVVNTVNGLVTFHIMTKLESQN